MPRCARPDYAMQPIEDQSPDPGLGVSSRVVTLLRMLDDACHDASAESESLRRENASLRERLRRFTEGATTAVDGVHPNASSTETDMDLVVCCQDHREQAESIHRERSAGSNTLRAEAGLQSAPTSSSVDGNALSNEFVRSPSQQKSSNALGRTKSPASTFSTEHHLKTVWGTGAVGNTSVCDLAALSASQVPPDMNEQSCAEAYIGFWQSLISFPGSPWRNSVDTIGFIFILYDMIVIPLQPFAPPKTWFSNCMDWIVLIFWTLNVFASVQVGYVENGTTIMNPQKILVHYLKTWFWLDIAVLVPDWYFTIQGLTAAGTSNSPEDVVKLLRISRLSKCLRLFRAAKLKALMRSLQDRISSEYGGLVFKICSILFALLLVNHYIASLWFAIGSLESFDMSWVSSYHYDREDWFSKYLVSYHWSLTQFTPASKVAVQPTNILERCFAILVVVFALVGFSYMLGSINCSLAQLRAMGEDAEKQFWQVRRYFRQNSVSSQLGARILRYLEHAYAKTLSRTDVKKIRIFDLLSDNLRSELRLEIALPQLKIHPLFVQLSIRFMSTMRRISTTCISYRSLAEGDVLFFPGEHATHLYFMVSGLLQYTLSRAGEAATSEWVEGREDWIAEPVLWVRSWYHQGTPLARLESEVLIVNPVAFSEAVVVSPATLEAVSSYALCFVDWLTNKHQNSWSDVYQGEDLFEEFAGFCNLDPDQIEANRPWHRKRHLT